MKMAKENTICELRGQVYNGTQKKEGKIQQRWHILKIHVSLWLLAIAGSVYKYTFLPRGRARRTRLCIKVPRDTCATAASGQRTRGTDNDRSVRAATVVTRPKPGSRRGRRAPRSKRINQGRMISGGPGQRRFRD